MRAPAYFALSAACLLVAPRSLAATEIPRHVVASGGGRAASAGHVVAGTAGQAVAGSAVSAHLALFSGFDPGSSDLGTFLEPSLLFATGVMAVPDGGTVWVRPGTYSAVGTYTKAMTLRGPLGGVTLGN